MFKWICLALAGIFGLAVVGLLMDLKRDLAVSLDEAKSTVADAHQTIDTINQQLPEIIREVKTGTQSLADLASDVELIKSVAGIRDEQAELGLRGLAKYADEIQKVLAEQAADREAVIMIEKLVGTDLKVDQTVEEFLVGLNKEMVAVILPLSKSNQEILYRACFSGPPFRNPFFIRFPDQEPERLDAFIRRHHPPSAALPAFRAGD